MTKLPPLATAPPVVPPAANPGGLFSAVQFRDGEESVRWFDGVKVESTPGGVLSTYGSYDCEADDNRVISSGVNWAGFNGFTVYSTFSCSPVGYNAGDVSRLALRRLLTFEEVSAEAHLWEDLAASNALDGFTDPLTDVDKAVGLLEHHLLRNYGGGIIHVPRWLVHKLPAVTTSGNRMTLRSGVQVVAGAGYGNPGADMVLVATPLMFGYRDEPTEYDPEQTFDRKKNVLAGVTERRYVIGWDSVGEPRRVTVKI